MNEAQMTGIAIGLGVLGALLLIIFLKANIVLCQPNELVVLAGRKWRQPDGSRIGYRVIRGGRGFKWPFVESVARLPLTTVPLEVQLPNAMSQGMIPLTVEGRATVKLAGRPEDGMDAAIERFLGKGPDAVSKTARQALEGAIRGIVATMTPEQANAERLELASQAAERARLDLQRLGVVLDFLQIQEISDEHGYLAAIGRRQNAIVQRDARIAEATADAEARQVAAEQQRLGRQAEITANLGIVEEENALAVKQADLEAKANQAQQRASVAGDIARTEAKLALEDRRVELSGKKQEAETIIPARAARQAEELRAQGAAARILEDGKATAQAVELMRAQWQDGESRDLFLIRLMPELLDQVTRVVSDNLRIDKLTILDGGDGEGLPTYVKNLTRSAVTLLEQVKNATGIDLAKLAEAKDKGEAGLPPQLGKA
jgi:flotillin